MSTVICEDCGVEYAAARLAHSSPTVGKDDVTRCHWRSKAVRAPLRVTTAEVRRARHLSRTAET